MAVNNLIKLRRGSASDWSSDPVLAQGEPGFDTTNNILKIGDGTTAWSSLAAVNNTDHPTISAASSSDNSGNTFIQDITLDSNGHVTAIAVATASEGGGGGIGNIVEDTTPQLGGNLDLNSKDIIGAGDINATGNMILLETMPDHCGIQIKSSGDANGELHVGSCSDANGVPNAMGLRHSTMTGSNDFMICADTDGATFISAKDTKSVNISAGGNDGDTKLELRDVAGPNAGFRFNVNKSNVDLQYNGDNENNVFYIDASEDSVGIGTAAPQTRLDVSGIITGSGFKTQNGTSSQFLKADGSVDTNTYSTTDTQLTEEQVEDFVGGMVTGNTETGITVTYDDSDGTLDFVVASQTDENFTTADHSKLDGIEAGADVTDTTNVTAAGALMDSELTDLAGVKGVTISTLQPKPSEGAFANGDKTKLDGIEASADVTDTANVTSAGALMDSEVTNLAQVKAFDSSDYATAAQGTKADSAQQPPSEGAFANGDKTKLDGIETGATADQTDEEIQDIVGAMLTGNTETGITVTYQDADGTIDFAVASQTDENFTTADHSKLDGIEASADVTDTANVTSAGALMDSELASIADVKALDQSVIAGASPNFVTTNMTDASDKRFMTDAQETKLDSIESSADVTDTANVTAAGALMDSELTDLAGVKGVTISTLQPKPSEGAFANGDKTKLDGIEANATADQTDEEIQDIVGAMVSSNTETGITVTYQDADGTLDFVVDHDAASNFVANEHIDHTSVTLTAGDGLTGGGDISANRTFAVNVDDSTIEINSDALRIKDAAITSAKIGAGGFVFNEAGAAVDFRVEGDTEQNLLFVDGSADKVGIGTDSPAGILHVKGEYSDGGHITIEDTSSALKTRFYNGNSASVIAVDEDGAVGSSSFIVQVDNSNKATFGASATTFDQSVTINASTNQAIFGNSITVFNEGGANIDFRVEGDTDTDLLFVDASTDTVQIGKLNINGAFTLPTSDGSANQILKTDGNGTVSWAADSTGGGGGGGSMTTVKANGSQVGGADIVTLDFASNFSVAETPDTEINIDLSDTVSTKGITATTGLIVGVSGLHHQSGTIVHSTEAAWGEFPGNAQNSLNLLTGRTTDANFTSLEMNNGMYSGVKLPSNKTFFADVNIVGRRTNTGNEAAGRQHAAYQLKACLHNDAYGRAVIGSVTKTVIAESNSAWDVQLAFAGAGSGQTDFLLVQCKGAASSNVNWVAKVDLLEVGGLNETSAYREANILTNMSPELIP